MSEGTDGKWEELIEIMNTLPDYRAHFVILLAKVCQELEREEKQQRVTP